MNGKIVFLKLVVMMLLCILSFALGYFNMTITWGVEIKSWFSFYFFLISSMIVTILIQLVSSINNKD